jgi:hypothetical protein
MRVAIALTVLTGCAVTEQNFPDRYAGAVCSQWRSCDEEQFYSDFEDVPECEDDVSVVVRETLDLFSLCEFVPEDARECLQAIRSSTCAEVEQFDFDGRCDGFVDCL